MHKIFLKTGQNASHIWREFQTDTNRSMYEHYYIQICSYYQKEICEVAPHCRIDTQKICKT